MALAVLSRKAFTMFFCQGEIAGEVLKSLVEVEVQLINLFFCLGEFYSILNCPQS